MVYTYSIPTLSLVAVFTADYLTINQVVDRKYLEVRWSRPVSSEEFRVGMAAITETICSCRAELLLVDFRQTGTPSLSDQNWLVRRLIAYNKNTTLRRSARLFSNDMVQNIVQEIITERIASFPYRCQVFGSEDLARQWLFHE